MSKPPAHRSRSIRSALAALCTCAMIGGLPDASQAAPPANDLFANASSINLNSLPFFQTVLMNEATTEGAEPIYCSYSTQTIWYRITPAADTWLNVSGAGVYGGTTVYRDTGTGLGGLQVVGCPSNTGGTFFVQAGITHYLQAGAYCCYVSGFLSLNLQQVAAPVPVANFYFYPSDPTTFDNVQFNDQSSDPGGQGIATRSWDFGDGGGGTVSDTSSSCCPTHRYASDGDYEVTLTVVTTDGRTASTSRTVSVRTHDVGIADFRTPQTAHVGQTREIAVSIRNTRYPEIVRVELQKGIPGQFTNFQTVGYLDQFVPARSKNKATDFVFSYTVSPADAALGKLIFRAVATPLGSRDAFFADNEAVSPLIRLGGGTGPVPVPETLFPNAGALEFAIEGVVPNPARVGSDLSVRLSLAKEGEVSLQVLDLAGRVVSARELGVLPAGRHETRLTWASRPSAGIYWVRISQPGEDPRTTRFALID